MSKGVHITTSEVFPDLHHKMSKKIAQLTKVIYHLNTKNEDHQSEIDNLTQQHQNEVQQILRDAATRIGKFKEMVESKQSSVNQEAKIDKLIKKHDLEKQAAQLEFNNFREKAAVKEQKIASEFQQKFDGLRKEVEVINKKFQEKLSQFESVNQDLQKALESSTVTGLAGLTELKKRHELEIAELVRTGNEKYQNMLLEQLNKQDVMKSEFEKRLDSEKKELSAKLKSDLETEIGQLRAKLSADKQEAIMSLKRELDDKLQQQKEEFLGKINKQLADAKLKAEESEALKRQKDAEINSLQARLKDLEAQYAGQLGGREEVVGQLSAELTNLREIQMQQMAALAQRDAELESLKQLLSDKNGNIARLEKELQASRDEVVRLQRELDMLYKSGADLEQDLKNKLSSSQKEAESFRAEINQMGTALAAAREDLKRAEKVAAKAASDADKTIANISSERDALQKKLADMMKTSSDSNEVAIAEINSLRKRLADREEDFKQEKITTQRAHDQALKEMRERHQAELNALSSGKQTIADDLAAKEKEYLAELNAQKQSYESKIDVLLKAHKKQLEEMSGQQLEQSERLKGSISGLESQLQAVTEQAESDKAALKSEATKLDSKAKALQKELDAKKLENERAGAVTTGLKNQIESLREELQASQKAFRDKMDTSQAKLESDWQAKLDAQIALDQKTLTATTSELRSGFKQEMDLTNQRHEAELQSLKSLLQKEANSAADDQAKLEREKQALQSALHKEKTERSAEVAQLKSTQAAEIKSLDDSRKQELDRTKKELREAADTKEKTLVSSHAAEVERLNKLLADTVSDLGSKANASTEQQRKAAEDQLRRALEELEKKLLAEKSKALADQQQSSDSDKANMKSKLDSEISSLSTQLSESKAQLKDTINEITSLNGVIKNERVERQRREEVFVMEKDQIARDHEVELRNEKESGEKKVVEALEKGAADVRAVKSEHSEVRSRYEDKIREAGKAYKALEEKYKNRESRPEDVARISQLEREMVEKDELVAKTREEMLYFKREMLNREENYNQKFNRTPNVGVMQVLKGKDHLSGSDSAATVGQGKDPSNAPSFGSRKPSPMRMIPATNNSNNAAMGLGIGIAGKK